MVKEFSKGKKNFEGGRNSRFGGKPGNDRPGSSKPGSGKFGGSRGERFDRPGRDNRSFQRPAPVSAPAQEPRAFRAENNDNAEASETLLLKGRHEVMQALDSEQAIESVYISTAVKGPIGGQIRELASKRHIPVKDMNPDTFEVKFGEKSQGIAAVCGSFKYYELEEFLDQLEAKKPAGQRIIVALNHVEDPRNLGAIVRTVEASGACGVIIPKHRSAGMTEWAVRTAQGAASVLPVIRVNNLGDTLEKLKDMQYWVVGLDGDGTQRYNKVVYSGNIVLVAGGEDAGLGERLKKVCDDVVSIPLNGTTPSLNVSVSVAVVLYEVLRQKEFFYK